MFTIINIIIIIIGNSMPERGSGYKTTPATSILCLSQFRVKLIFIGARSFSTLRVQVVLGRPFGIFHPAAGYLNGCQKSFPDDHPLVKHWQRDRINITGLNECCRLKTNTSLESQLLVNIAVPF